MTNWTPLESVARMLQSFYGSFGLPAFPEQSVPDKDENGDELEPPYITYSVSAPDWRSNMLHHARVYWRSYSLSEVSAKADEIAARIGEGITLRSEDGYITLAPGQPFMQFQPVDEKDEIKVVYINMEMGGYIRRKG